MFNGRQIRKKHPGYITPKTSPRRKRRNPANNANQAKAGSKKLYLGLDPLDTLILSFLLLLLRPLCLSGTLQVLLLLFGQRLEVGHPLLAGLWSFDKGNLAIGSVEDVVAVLSVCPAGT